MEITRRALSLGLFAPLAAPPASTAANPHARKCFKEVAASLYTWDLALVQF